jgi:bacillithiol system protein YtxJ
MAKSRLERGPLSPDIDYHYLDLLQFRPVSNQIAEQFNIHHESPQILLIKNGECIYEESHNGIDPEEILLQCN